jgi:dTDP-glucose 4,6-dehydratase
MKVLVTGGAGFIGSHFVKKLVTHSKYNLAGVTVLDSLTYAGNLKNLGNFLDFPNTFFYQGDISRQDLPDSLFWDVDAIVNFAAESHVDRSIKSSRPFFETNVIGTQNLLEKSIRFGVEKFLQVSTDEVYGSITTGDWTEESPLQPNSPYAASKAGADLLVNAFAKTHGIHTNITRCSNNFGTHQYPEKFIPVIIRNLVQGNLIPIYGDGSNTRDWLSVDDHCNALVSVLFEGSKGEVYNIGGGVELSNLALVKEIVRIMGRSSNSWEFVEDRKGHDFRYSVSHAKISTELGYSPNADFLDSLAKTVDWYINNPHWWS